MTIIELLLFIGIAANTYGILKEMKKQTAILEEIKESQEGGEK